MYVYVSVYVCVCKYMYHFDIYLHIYFCIYSSFLSLLFCLILHWSSISLSHFLSRLWSVPLATVKAHLDLQLVSHPIVFSRDSQMGRFRIRNRSDRARAFRIFTSDSRCSSLLEETETKSYAVRYGPVYHHRVLNTIELIFFFFTRIVLTLPLSRDTLRENGTGNLCRYSKYVFDYKNRARASLFLSRLVSSVFFFLRFLSFWLIALINAVKVQL